MYTYTYKRTSNHTHTHVTPYTPVLQYTFSEVQRLGTLAEVFGIGWDLLQE